MSALKYATRNSVHDRHNSGCCCTGAHARARKVSARMGLLPQGLVDLENRLPVCGSEGEVHVVVLQRLLSEDRNDGLEMIGPWLAF
jgi:hypothetical protein